MRKDETRQKNMPGGVLMWNLRRFDSFDNENVFQGSIQPIQGPRVGHMFFVFCLSTEGCQLVRLVSSVEMQSKIVATETPPPLVVVHELLRRRLSFLVFVCHCHLVLFFLGGGVGLRFGNLEMTEVRATR